MKSMAIIYFQNPWQSSYKSPWKVMIIYLRPMVNINHKKHLRLLFKSPKENIIYKIIQGKNYEKTIQVVI